MILDRAGAALSAAAATLLGALALSPVFSTAGWFPPVLGVVAVVLGGGVLLRTGGPILWYRLSGGRAAPARLSAAAVVLVPLAQLALVGSFLTARYAPERALAGFLPTWDSLADLGAVLAGGGAEIREQAAPALPLTGLVAVTVLFVGVIAVLVDLLAVVGRQAAVGGVSLVILFCVPVATLRGDIGLLAIVGPATGFAVLLRCDQRRRLVSPDRSPRRVLGAGTVNAVRIGVLALVAGVVLGALVPTLVEGSFASGLGGGSGNATGTSLDPVVELRGQLLREDPIQLLRLDSSVEDPGYLRAVALDEYDTELGWTVSNLDGEITVADDESLAPLPDDQDSRRVTATIQALEHDDRFLPVPASALTVRMLSGDDEAWRFDPATGTIFGRGRTTAGQTWTVTAEEPRPSPELLASAAVPQTAGAFGATFIALPELDPSVIELVAGLTSAEDSSYGRVRAILDFFTDRSEGFRYSLSTRPGTGGDDVADFLRLRRGYCEQYAGAMAVMVRAAGVPARVVLGYTPGTEQDDGSRLISSDDAHAWVEVFFEDLGWVPFDPTPIAAGRAVDLPWAPRVGADDSPDLPEDVPAPDLPAPLPAPRPDAGDGAGASDGSSAAAPGIPPRVLAGLGGAVVLAALAAAPGAARVVQRRRRIAEGDARSLWDELGATAADLGRPAHPSWTPARMARELAIGERGFDDALARLARAEERASYGPADDPVRRAGAASPSKATGTANSADPGLVADLRAVRRGLLRAAPRNSRLRASIWPASLLDRLRTRLGRRGSSMLRPT